MSKPQYSLFVLSSMKPFSRFPTIFITNLSIHLIYNVMAITKHSAEDYTEIQPLIAVDQKLIPYQAGVLYHGRFKCGATLVHFGSNQFILTAARCVGFGQPPTNIPIENELIQVFAETTNILNVEDITERRNVTKIVIHPCFNVLLGNFQNNIAIIFPTEDFDVREDGVKPAHLPPTQGYKIPSHVTVSGYGNKEWGAEGDGELRKIDMPTYDWDICRNSKIAERQFCAGIMEKKGIGICEGDEGGPAMGYDANGGMNFYLAGIISHVPHWCRVCGDGHTLSVFTDVSLYLDWIKIELLNRMKPVTNKTLYCDVKSSNKV